MTRPRVVVLDDDAEILKLAGTLLERAGYEVAGYSGRFDRVNFVAGQAPDLVLIDVNMPAVGGDELFELLRDDPRLAGVPLVFLSSNDETELRRLVRHTGAAGYIPKSALGDDFAARVARFLGALVPAA